MTTPLIDEPAPEIDPEVVETEPGAFESTAEASTETDTEAGAAEDLGFGKAIVIGAALGIVVMTVALAALVKVLAPDIPAGAIAAIAAWTGVWAGLFLGGTVTVGRWSRPATDPIARPDARPRPRIGGSPVRPAVRPGWPRRRSR